MFFPDFDLKNSRYERKFQVSDMQLAAVHQQIRLHPAAFSLIFYPRYINNIYLDTADLDAFHENLTGHGKRKKARVRWYGDMMGEVVKPVLEFKIKEGILGNKLLFPLKSFKMDESFDAGMLRDIFLRSSLPDWALETVLKQKPSLVNRYKRTYYMTFDKKFRLTVDEEMSYFAIGPSPNYFLEKYVSSDLVVELKYAYADYQQAIGIADYLPFRLTKSSKYVNGIGMIFSIPV